MNITLNVENAKYQKDKITDTIDNILATINGIEVNVPLDPDNIHYAELMRMVDEDELTIEAAD